MTVPIPGGRLLIKMTVSSSISYLEIVEDSAHLVLTPFPLHTDTNEALHFYSHDNVRTTNGVLNITTERKINNYKAFNEKTKKFFPDKKYIQTGMIQGWNKFCFIGGIVEFRAKLPGDPKIGGLWPACKTLAVITFPLFLFERSE